MNVAPAEISKDLTAERLALHRSPEGFALR